MKESEKLEYTIIPLRVSLEHQAGLLNHLNEVEGWELVTVFRGRPTTNHPHGRVFAYLKRPLRYPD